MLGSQEKNLEPKVNVKFFTVDPYTLCHSLTPFSDLVDLADMAPFGAEKHVFRWSRQLGKSNMDSFWMISGFFGPPE